MDYLISKEMLDDIKGWLENYIDLESNTCADETLVELHNLKPFTLGELQRILSEIFKGPHSED